MSYWDYLSTVKETAAYVQLSDWITTHSARIGGAIHDFFSAVSAETIESIGRWSNVYCLQHYLRNGRSWIMTMPMGKGSHARVKRHSTKPSRSSSNAEKPLNHRINSNRHTKEKYGLPPFPSSFVWHSESHQIPPCVRTLHSADSKALSKELLTTSWSPHRIIADSKAAPKESLPTQRRSPENITNAKD